MSTKSDSDDFAASIIAMVVIAPAMLLVIIPFLLWSGWAATVLWGWFIVPAFGLPQITITQAAGICLVFGVLRVKLAAPKDETTWGTKFIAMLIGPPMSVGLGWIIKWLAL